MPAAATGRRLAVAAGKECLGFVAGDKMGDQQGPPLCASSQSRYSMGAEEGATAREARRRTPVEEEEAG
uniref:Uncharacterized protein n=1 Tax=Oryza meridionalis TaxID=40149 RepID=A0A0E0CK07_9ORYZ